MVKKDKTINKQESDIMEVHHTFDTNVYTLAIDSQSVSSGVLGIKGSIAMKNINEGLESIDIFMRLLNRFEQALADEGYLTAKHNAPKPCLNGVNKKLEKEVI